MERTSYSRQTEPGSPNFSDFRDGIYKVKHSTAASDYLVLKHYNGETKHRFFESEEDCRQQMMEWDDDYRKEHPEDTKFKGGFRKEPKKKVDGYNRTFQVINSETKDVCFTGKSKEVAEEYKCHVNTVLSAAKKSSCFMHLFTVEACA